MPKRSETKEPELKFNGMTGLKSAVIDDKTVDILITELNKLKESYPDEVLLLYLDIGSLDFKRYKVI